MKTIGGDMLRRTIFHIPVAIVAAAVTISAQAPATPGQGAPAGQAGRGPAAPPMVLSTPAFSDGAVIPNRFTQVEQAERGVSPQFVWTNAPAATQSFVLHMHDPEVSRNRTTDDQVHWLVWNIPATEKGLPEGMPEGAQLPNGIRQISASGNVYRGPGAADAWETRRNVFKAMDGHVIGKAVMVGMFKRPQ